MSRPVPFADLPSLPPDASQRVVEAILIKAARETRCFYPYGAHWVAGAICDALGVDRRQATRPPEHIEIDETNWTPARDMYPVLNDLLEVLSEDSNIRVSLTSALNTIDLLSQRVAVLTADMNSAVMQIDNTETRKSK